jgi:hypothetical protein
VDPQKEPALAGDIAPEDRAQPDGLLPPSLTQAVAAGAARDRGAPLPPFVSGGVSRPAEPAAVDAAEPEGAADAAPDSREPDDGGWDVAAPEDGGLDDGGWDAAAADDGGSGVAAPEDGGPDEGGWDAPPGDSAADDDRDDAAAEAPPIWTLPDEPEDVMDPPPAGADEPVAVGFATADASDAADAPAPGADSADAFPIDAFILPDVPPGDPLDVADVARRIEHLADRLADMALELRENGTAALQNRIHHGDRLDAVIAAVLAGFLSAGDEDAG